MTCQSWPPPRRSPPFYLVIAASVLTVEETLPLKTVKAGIIGRLAAAFRVDRIIVYRDEDSTREDYRLFRLLLRYMATPPYLRRRIFPLRRELRYAGLLPPLRAPLHDVPSRPEKGMFIAGLVESCRGDRCRVYLGSLGTGYSVGHRLPAGSVGVFRVADTRGPRLEYVDNPGFYTWFDVEGWPSLRSGLLRAKDKGWMIIGTSRRGSCIRLEHIVHAAMAEGPVLLVFGGPRGDVVKEAGHDVYDMVVNTIPWQGVKTVRTEEALAATLSLFNACNEAAQSL